MLFRNAFAPKCEIPKSLAKRNTELPKNYRDLFGGDPGGHRHERPNMGKLEVGAFGDEVRDLHRKLTKHGFEIPSSEIDRGFFGPGTRDAVVQWQRNHRLPVTGIFDERTNATLDAAPDSSPVQPSKPGPSSVSGAKAPLGSFPPQGPGSLVPSRTAMPQGGPTEIFGREIADMFAQARAAASKWTTRDVTVNGEVVHVQYPFASPSDWRERRQYFFILARVETRAAPPKGPSRHAFEEWQD